MAKPSWVVRAIADPTKNFLAFFLVGTLLFTIVSDGVSYLVWDWLGTWVESRWGIQQAWFRGALTVGLMLLLLGLTYGTNLARWLMGQLRRSPLFAAVEVPQANVVPLQRTYPGLIVAMSPKPHSPAEEALRFHWNGGQGPHLQDCWMICTQQSLPFATDLAERLTAEGATQTLRLHYGAYKVENPEMPGEMFSLVVPDALMDDPNYIQQLVNAIYADAESLGLAESEVIADYTGATKGLTAGMLLACTRPERPLQYISQVNPGQIMAVQLSYRLRPVRKRRSPR
ncbi:MAG: hypothetical protein OHK0037_06790 [Elainellaceae cyanobacterium]